MNWLQDIIDRHVEAMASEIRAAARLQEVDREGVEIALFTLGLDPIVTEIRAQDPAWR